MNHLIKNANMGSGVRTVPREKTDASSIHFFDDVDSIQTKDLVMDTAAESEKPNLEIEIEQIKQDAYNIGLEEGRKAASKEINEKINELDEFYAAENESLQSEYKTKLTGLESLLVECSEFQDKIFRGSQEELLAVLLRCLYKLAGHKDIYRQIVAATLTREIDALKEESKLLVKLPSSSSEDMDFVSDLDCVKSDICKVIYDASLEPGECLVEAGYSIKEDGIIRQLDQVRDELINVLRGN